MPRIRVVLVIALLASVLAPPPPARGAEAGAPVPDVGDSLAVFEAAGRWRDAERAAVARVAALERAGRPDSVALAWMLLRQAGFARNGGRVGDGTALGAAERAVAIAGRLQPREALLLCRALSFASLLHVDLAQGDSALARVRRALDVATSMAPRSDSVLGSLYFREGQVHRVRSDYAAAIEPLRRSLELTLRRLGPVAPGVGFIHNEIGRAFTYLGEFDSARVHQEAALRVAEANSARSTEGLENALISLLTLERRAGNPARAVEHGMRAYELYVARLGESGADVSAYLANLAAAFIALGDFARARGLLEEVVGRQSAALPATHADLLQNRVSLAMTCLRTGDAAAARRELDGVDSLNVAGPRGATTAAYAAAVRTSLELEAGRFAAARQVLLGAAHRAPPMLSSRIDLAARLLETVRGEADAALLDSLERVVDAWADSTDAPQLKNWTALLVDRALAGARLGRRERAWEQALRAEAIARERFHWEIEALPDRAALLHDEDAADPSQALVELADPARPGEVRAAWESVVRRRGAVREAVEARHQVPVAGDSALAAAHANWVAAARRHARLLVGGEFDAGERDARARFEASRAAADDAERRYAALAAAAGRDAAAPSLERVLAKLRQGEALVAFVRAVTSFQDARLFAFVARGGEAGPHLVRLGDDAPVAAAVGAWLAALASPPPADARRARTAEAGARAAGERVRRLVWDPLADALGEARAVHVVAAGPVRDLPWLALPAAGGRYLAEGGMSLQVLVSERDLLRHDVEARSAGLLAVGDPDFEGGHAGGATPAASARRRLPWNCARAEVKLAALPGARAEARAIAALWSRGGDGRGEARLLLGADATEERFKALARGSRVIHVATHGILTRDSCAKAALATRGVGGVTELAPTQARPRKGKTPAAPADEASPWIGRDAWLAFAGANHVRAKQADENEGWLTADEVVTLDLRGTERVVLSACQSGVVDRWSEDAVHGMRRAFHLAGARCVVASLWPIADEATRVWMEAFYASPSRSTGAALQEAARAVIAKRRGEGLAPHPFYWAAFTATGD